MPVFYQQIIDEHTQLGVWNITEQEDFFLQRVPLKRDVTHPHKRLQHLAGRFLLPYLFADFPLKEILIADTRKPYLENEQYHFSISHCNNFAAAIASSTKRVGIDVERVTPKMTLIQHKFLGDAEWERAVANWQLALGNSSFEFGIWNLEFDQNCQLLTLLWSCKEAIFKWYGSGKVDFKKHMQLNGEIKTIEANEWILPFVLKKDSPIQLHVHAKFFDNLILAWVVS